jgi:hypothetical protein
MCKILKMSQAWPKTKIIQQYQFLHSIIMENICTKKKIKKRIKSIGWEWSRAQKNKDTREHLTHSHVYNPRSYLMKKHFFFNKPKTYCHNTSVWCWSFFLIFKHALGQNFCLIGPALLVVCVQLYVIVFLYCYVF